MVELLVSMAVMTLLLGGMASALVVAGHALPDENQLSARTAAAVAAVEQISRDLLLSTTIISADQNTVWFTVPDRSHGAAGPETVRYSWSGTLQDPLQYYYNGGPAITLCDDVHEFTLEYSRKAKPLQSTPRVLLVVRFSSYLLPQEKVIKDAMERWGYSVRTIGATTSPVTFQAALLGCDVLYISRFVTQIAMTDKVSNPSRGIVLANVHLCNFLQISEDSCWYTGDSIELIDNRHVITHGFSNGLLTICSSSQPIAMACSFLAAGTQILGRQPYAGDPALATIEVDGHLTSGEGASARRVLVPSATALFDFKALSADGLALERRAIVWAAAPIGISGVRIALQLGSEPKGRVETYVQLLNTPEKQ